jgi:hypothetical protein
MELIELDRWYNKKKKHVIIYLEIAYSTGRLKQRQLEFDLSPYEGLVWQGENGFFDVSHPDAFEINYALVRIDQYIYEIFSEGLVDGDIGPDECLDILLRKIKEKDANYWDFRLKTLGK